MSLLSIKNLRVTFPTARGDLRALTGVDLDVRPGEILGVVGESGCGKSLTGMATMGLLPPQAQVSADAFTLNEQPLLQCKERDWRRLRGEVVSMIFQDPMASLDPSYTIGYQLKEVLLVHKQATAGNWRQIALGLLKKVGVTDPEHQLDAYPHQLSGGMCQRMMIAIAIACKPKLLIADEPTTALDVTIQAQILKLLKDLQRQEGMALILVTHDLGVVAQMADRIAVMYAGQIIETGTVDEIIYRPRHPYTQGLLRCLPQTQQGLAHKGLLSSIKGMVPDLVNRPSGCAFHPRCAYADGQCHAQTPQAQTFGQRRVTCWHPVAEGGLS